MQTDTFHQWWVAHFCIRMIHLRPDMSVRAATEQGRVNFAHAGDMDPEEAADIFVERHPGPDAWAWTSRQTDSPRANA
jgi:hypothetical protein